MGVNNRIPLFLQDNSGVDECDLLLKHGTHPVNIKGIIDDVDGQA